MTYFRSVMIMSICINAKMATRVSKQVFICTQYYANIQKVFSSAKSLARFKNLKVLKLYQNKTSVLGMAAELLQISFVND